MRYCTICRNKVPDSEAIKLRHHYRCKPCYKRKLDGIRKAKARVKKELAEGLL